MAYLELTAGQVDADSPLDATLFGQIRDNEIAHEAEKLERDGTIPMTGNLAMGTNAITGATAIDGTGDLTMGTITMIAGSGTGLDMNGKDIITEDIQINGSLSGANIVASTVEWSLVGATETAAAGTLKDSTNTIDFTAHLTASGHWTYVPAVKTYFCPIVSTITDVDNITLKNTDQSADNSLDYGNGNAYSLVENGSWIQSKTTITTGGAAVMNADFSMLDEDGGLQRTWIRVDITFSGGGPKVIDVVYGGETTTVFSGNAVTNAICYLRMKTGTNTLNVNSQGQTLVSSSVFVSVDHPTKLSASVA